MYICTIYCTPYKITIKIIPILLWGKLEHVNQFVHKQKWTQLSQTYTRYSNLKITFIFAPFLSTKGYILYGYYTYYNTPIQKVLGYKTLTYCGEAGGLF